MYDYEKLKIPHPPQKRERKKLKVYLTTPIGHMIFDYERI